MFYHYNLWAMGENYNLKKLVFFFVSLEQRLCNIRNTKKLTVQCTIVFLFCILITGTFLPLIEAQVDNVNERSFKIGNDLSSAKIEKYPNFSNRIDPRILDILHSDKPASFAKALSTSSVRLRVSAPGCF